MMFTEWKSPQRYIQGRNTLNDLGIYVQPLGSRTLVVADDSIWNQVRKKIEPSFKAARIEWERVCFGGECSEQEIERIWREAEAGSFEVVVGIGDPKALDTAKAVGARLEANWVTVPAILSTHASVTALSTLYTHDGAFERYEFHSKCPDLVLLDTSLLAEAPVRCFAAAIGEGLATWIEARTEIEAKSPMVAAGLPTRAGSALAKLGSDILFTYSIPALVAVERRAVTPAVEAVLEAATLLGGLGFMGSGGAARSIANGFTVLPQGRTALYGERIAFGALVQLFLEGRFTGEINEMLDFYHQVKLPTTLRELGLADVGHNDLWHVAEAACAPGESIFHLPFEVSPHTLFDAIQAADAYGQAAYVEWRESQMPLQWTEEPFEVEEQPDSHRYQMAQ